MTKQKLNRFKCFRFNTFKKTKDCWNPNFPGNVVRVSIMLHLPTFNTKDESWHRVCVWGDDDTGMEKDFVHHEIEKAQKCFNQIMEMSNVDFQALEDIGFRSA